MYHPERFNETIGEMRRGIEQFTWAIYPYFLPHKHHEISEDTPKIYRPRTFEGIYRHRHKLRTGRVLMPRETRMHQKYSAVLAELHEEETTSPDGLNKFTKYITEELERKGVLIERNWFPYRIPQKKCMQFNVWYRMGASVHERAEYVACAAYTDGLDPEDLAIWINVSRNRSIQSIGHAQLIVKYYPENWFTLFQHLSVNLMHPDIYSLQQPANLIYPR